MKVEQFNRLSQFDFLMQQDSLVDYLFDCFCVSCSCSTWLCVSNFSFKNVISSLRSLISFDSIWIFESLASRAKYNAFEYIDVFLQFEYHWLWMAARCWRFLSDYFLVLFFSLHHWCYLALIHNLGIITFCCWSVVKTELKQCNSFWTDSGAAGL